ncbi:pyridoxamine 5'-phosphate oxidase family protein [Sporolactobacillus shoreicorticis]|uniref:Pyridoxamine 5'-phosphate oxidase family protein n=1 Tax=Sporolactobacillus shoreicorticis TaxID=1923877 RepID=A0ABW5RYA6_9BACL|nr:pyridoxamine 5'-phosphate oxidase family protein [Sporolactobacillus shoreicorticis]MCO7124870.1 pyridoxamine 5'-phosphate oxidase family protein [Sporolactobacillus shoreicorticis]
MKGISYKQRICNDKERIDRFLIEKRVGSLGMSDKSKPYTIPVNYVFLNGKIYIHGLGTGRKNHILRENAHVCFTVFEELGTVKSSVPCKCDTSYFSVVIFGKAMLVEDPNEKIEALGKFLEKFTPGLFDKNVLKQVVERYHSSLNNKAVSVYCICPEHLTAKENPVDMNHMFTAIEKMR